MTLTILLGACTRWEPYTIPMAPTPALPSSLRIWSPGIAATELAEPFVQGDTLYGRFRGDTIGVAMSTIERVARPRLDGLRTAGAVVGGVIGWIALGLGAGGWE